MTSKELIDEGWRFKVIEESEVEGKSAIVISEKIYDCELLSEAVTEFIYDVGGLEKGQKLIIEEVGEEE